MAVRISINYEGEHEGSCHTIELPDEALNAVNIALGNIKNEYSPKELNEVPDKVLLAFEDLTDALENVVEVWDEYTNEYEVDDDFVDHVDCHLNEMLVHHLKLADTIWMDLD